MNDDIKNVLLDILHMGLLRIRAFGGVGGAEGCVLEADHLHNIPYIIQSASWELLVFYYTVEKPGFASRDPRGSEQFAPLWDRLGKLIETKMLATAHGT